jgi:hypothetical protein
VYASAATIASTTISGVTANGMLWMVSPGDGRRLGDGEQLILAGLAEIQLLQGRGQPDTHAERNDVVDLLGRPVLQGQLGESAEVHLLAVHEVRCLGQRREPVVDRVGGRQAAALEAHSRQQRVGLHHLLQRRGDDVLLGGLAGQEAVVEQGVPAQLGEGQRRRGGRPRRPWWTCVPRPSPGPCRAVDLTIPPLPGGVLRSGVTTHQEPP